MRGGEREKIFSPPSHPGVFRHEKRHGGQGTKSKLNALLLSMNSNDTKFEYSVQRIIN